MITASRFASIFAVGLAMLGSGFSVCLAQAPPPPIIPIYPRAPFPTPQYAAPVVNPLPPPIVPIYPTTPTRTPQYPAPIVTTVPPPIVPIYPTYPMPVPQYPAPIVTTVPPPIVPIYPTTPIRTPMVPTYPTPVVTSPQPQQPPPIVPIYPNNPPRTTSTPLVPQPPINANGGLTADENRLIELVNAARAKNGVNPLAVNPQLMASARGHSANQARLQKLTHDIDGKGYPNRIKDAGYPSDLVGENVGGPYFSAEAVMNAWMGSDIHRRNILYGDYTSIGVGAQNGYWTQDFGGK